MVVNDPPVCPRCANEPGSVAKLEQHVRAPSSSCNGADPPKGLLDGASERVSLEDPLNSTANTIGPPRQRQRMPPAWMTLLPSNRCGVSNSREPTIPTKRPEALLRQQERNSTLSVTPPQSPCFDRKDHSFRASPPHTPTDSGAHTALPSPMSILTKDVHATGEVSVTSSDQERLEVAALRRFSSSKPQSPLTQGSSSPRLSEADSKDRARRSFSIHKGINTFRKSSNAKPVLALVGSSESHIPMPSQDIVPAKAPFFKELAGFFTSRAKKGKLALPSRIGDSREDVELDKSGRSTPGQGTHPMSCAKCGMNMTNWRVSGGFKIPNQDQDGRGDRRMCESCKTAAKMPRSMPGSWN